MNVWDSFLIMTVIDLLVIIGFSVGFYLVYIRNNGFVRNQAKRGFTFLFLGLGAFVVFFSVDLAAMHLLPLLVPMEEAMTFMEELHLNYNWVVLPLGVLLMVVGTSQVINKYAEVIFDLKASQQKISNELEKRKKAEKSLAEAQKMAGLGNWDWDMITNKLVWSDEIYNICGMDRQKSEATFPTFMSIIPPEDRKKVEKAIDDAIHNGTPFDITHRILLPENVILQVHQLGEVVRDDQDQPISMVGTLQDVTNQKILEGKAQQAYRIKTIGQLAGGVAHDFNNLLAVVYGNLGLLKLALTNKKKINRKEALSLTTNSLEAAKSGAGLVKRLLAFSRQQNLAPKKFAVNDALENMLEFLKRSIGETITVELNTAKQNLMVNVDPGQFETSILNLALNARDAMPAGGRLTLRTEAMKVKVMGNATEDLETGDYVLISVVDTGEGMSKDVQEHVLEPFFTTKDVGEGSGLGLSSVFGFVKQSKGHLIINSEQGKGTIVQIYLPRVDPSVDKKPAPVKRALKPFEISGKVLVVEDNPKVRNVVAETVKKLGFEARMAANAREAFQIIENEDDITFLLSDIVMPGGMLGTELALKARELKPSLPILLMSGYADYISGDEKPDIKGIKVLQKPFSPEQLADQITLTCQEFGERVPNAFKT